MPNHSKQALENCKELNGIVAMFAADAESDGDKMLMAGTLISLAIRLYQRANMDYEEIDAVFQQAIPEFKKINDKKKKK